MPTMFVRSVFTFSLIGFKLRHQIKSCPSSINSMGGYPVLGGWVGYLFHAGLRGEKLLFHTELRFLGFFLGFSFIYWFHHSVHIAICYCVTHTQTISYKTTISTDLKTKKSHIICNQDIVFVLLIFSCIFRVDVSVLDL